MKDGISYLSCCCDEMFDTSNLKKDLFVIMNSRYSPLWLGSHDGRHRRQLVKSHTKSEKRNECCGSALSSAHGSG